jgi:hypothetical protein
MHAGSSLRAGCPCAKLPACAPWVVDSRRYAFFLGHRSIRSVTLWFFVTTVCAVLVNDLEAAPALQQGQTTYH